MTDATTADAADTSKTLHARKRVRVVLAATFGIALMGAALAAFAARGSSHTATVLRERWAIRFGDERRAVEAVRRLGELGAPSAVGDLVAFIERAPAAGAELAYEALARIGDPSAIPFLTRAARGEIAYEDARLAGLLKQQDRKWALVALVALGDKSAENAVIDALLDAEGPILERKDFGIALTTSSAPRAAAALEQVARADAEDRNVRLAAIKGLALSGDARRLATALDVVATLTDPRLLDGAVRFVSVAEPPLEGSEFGELVRTRPEPLRTASLLLAGEPAIWAAVESRADGLGPAIEEALYTLASARTTTRGAMREHIDAKLCRLASLRQGGNVALPEEARERREAGIAQALVDACGSATPPTG